MDPKAPSNLDPKLKEVYDRVMGTPTSTPTPPAITPNPSQPAAPTNSSLPNATLASPTPLSTSPTLPPPVSPVPDKTFSPLGTTAITHEAPPATVLNPGGPASTSTSLGGSISTSAANKATIDYAALAAKYATPTPPIAPENPNQKPVSHPASLNFGVANGDKKEEKKDKEKDKTTEPKKSGKRKILLIIGIPLLIFIYTIVWIIVFKVDITALLPLPQ